MLLQISELTVHWNIFNSPITFISRTYNSYPMTESTPVYFVLRSFLAIRLTPNTHPWILPIGNVLVNNVEVISKVGLCNTISPLTDEISDHCPPFQFLY